MRTHALKMNDIIISQLKSMVRSQLGIHHLDAIAKIFPVGVFAAIVLFLLAIILRSRWRLVPGGQLNSNDCKVRARVDWS